MTDSILDSIKAALGVPAEHTNFDTELILYINSILSTLTQLGVGPEEGFSISSKDDTWSSLIGDQKTLNDAKTYISLRAKMLFDTPTNPSVLTALKEQIQEHAWRLNVTVDDEIIVEPEDTLTL